MTKRRLAVGFGMLVAFFLVIIQTGELPTDGPFTIVEAALLDDDRGAVISHPGNNKLARRAYVPTHLAAQTVRFQGDTALYKFQCRFLL